MYKYVFKEIEQEEIDVSYYFDGDCFNGNAGGYEYNLFIIASNYGKIYGLNSDAYEELQEEVNQIYNDFEYAENHKREYNYKQAMKENGLVYSATKAHKLKELFDSCRYPDDIETLADYLTIKTGKNWDVTSVNGYCQGDYVEILYCKDIYPDPEMYGELWLGCCKEFSLTYLDENEQETDDTIYGYFIADCQYRNDEDLKKVLCEYEGTKPEETKVLLID